MASPVAVLGGDAVVDAIIARLLDDNGPSGVATLVGNRIYRDVGKWDTASAGAYPMVTVTCMSADDESDATGGHVYQTVIAMTKVTNRGSDYSATLQIAARVSAQLDQYERVTINGVYITLLRRAGTPAQPAAYIEGARYSYSNALWKTEAQPA